MFEVIISSVLTGHVIRKTFHDSRRADGFIDRFFLSEFGRPRRDYRVEVHARLWPAPAPRPAQAPTAA